MLVVETISKIRRAHYVQHQSIKAICRELGVSRKVVRKVLRSDATDFHYERSQQPKPKIDPWRGDLDQLLATNADKPRRERLTLVRIYEEIRGLGYLSFGEWPTVFAGDAKMTTALLDRLTHPQIVADSHGNTVVLGTRDCSLQRRNQKLVEEAPAPFITDAQRTSIHDAARAICAEAGYTGAGTVEFLMSQTGVISFLEVNTRLQVEHPVTEETTGVDIVAEQLRIADGLPLSFSETPAPRGHAFEFRINAEDPGRGFLPTPGLITRFRAPTGPGIRLDTGVEAGLDVPGIYDSLMAKLVVTGPTREIALQRARRALAEFQIEGVATVLPFHRAVVAEPDFTDANEFRVFTNWIETEFSGIEPAPRVEPCESSVLYSFIEIDGKRHKLGLPSTLFSGLAAAPSTKAEAAVPGSEGSVTAPISCTLQQWLVEDGAQVVEGDTVALIEAMKMETRILAPKSGRIRLKAEAGSSAARAQFWLPSSNTVER